MTPDNVKIYAGAGHEVYIEKGAGLGSGFTDAEYEAAGAKMIDTAKEVWDTVEMMIKVKEPLPEEYPLFHEGLILYTYLHLAADKPQTDALLNGKVKGVAYETLFDPRQGGLPLLAPMSQIAGRLSIQEGAKYLEKRFGGEGVLLAGVPGTPKANIVILGGGNVIVAGGDRRLPVFLRAGYGLALRSDANSAPGAPAGERADGNAPLHLLLAGECGRFRFRDELGTDLDITWSDGAVHIEGDYRFLLTWEVLPVDVKFASLNV